MKKWTLILLLTTLTGTFFPCCLVDKCNEKDIAASKKEDNQQTGGACSPFFACTTCHGFVEISQPFQMIQPVFENRVYPYKPMASHLAKYSSSFWQPPRDC